LTQSSSFYIPRQPQ